MDPASTTPPPTPWLQPLCAQAPCGKSILLGWSYITSDSSSCPGRPASACLARWLFHRLSSRFDTSPVTTPATGWLASRVCSPAMRASVLLASCKWSRYKHCVALSVTPPPPCLCHHLHPQQGLQLRGSHHYQNPLAACVQASHAVHPVSPPAWGQIPAQQVCLGLILLEKARASCWGWWWDQWAALFCLQ
jgi:hypothetical protein